MVAAQEPSAVQSVGVIGLGLIGGSLALALRAAGLKVVVWDTDPETRAQAATDGLEVGEDATAPARTDVVFIATPLRAFAATLEAIRPVLSVTTVVSDVGSVKAAVQQQVEAAGLGAQFIGAHPMAGTEHVGYAHADADLLTGARWVVTDSDQSRPEAVQAVVDILAGPMQSHVVRMTPEQHDQVVARISHAPHVLAAALVHVAAEGETGDLALELAAGSFRDGTRVMAATAERAAAMVSANAASTAQALDALIAELDQAREWLRDPLSAENIDEWFTRAVDVRSTWGKTD